MGFRVNAITAPARAVAARAVPFGAALLLMLPVSPAQASTPLGVRIDIETTFADPSYGPFTATGAAVEAGLVCPEGDTVDIGVKIVGWLPGQVILQDLRQFTCADGSGTFEIKAQLRATDRLGYATASWAVVDGTGAYQSLQGTGRASGFPTGDSSSHDELIGTMH